MGETVKPPSSIQLKLNTSLCSVRVCVSVSVCIYVCVGESVHFSETWGAVAEC